MGNSPSVSNKRIFSNEYGFHSFNVNSHFAGVSLPNKRQKKSFSARDECELTLPNDILDLSDSHPDLSEVTSLFQAANIDPNNFTLYNSNSNSQHNNTCGEIFQADEDLEVSGSPCSANDQYFSVKRTEFPEEMQRFQADNGLVSTVFRWNGGGKEIFISGTFNSWEKKVPMVKTASGAWVIIECTPGRHEYKYFIDGAWYHDPTKPFTDNKYGTKNNVIEIQPSDQDVLASLEKDIENSKHSNDEGSKIESRGNSPPGEYTQIIPPDPRNTQKLASNFVDANKGIIKPPILPPHLLQGLLNKSTGEHCDPNLLPEPNHVMLNHLYALSIKNGVIVLSVISRYRKKFVSTLFYKPIDSPKTTTEPLKSSG